MCYEGFPHSKERLGGWLISIENIKVFQIPQCQGRFWTSLDEPQQKVDAFDDVSSDANNATDILKHNGLLISL